MVQVRRFYFTLNSKQIFATNTVKWFKAHVFKVWNFIIYISSTQNEYWIPLFLDVILPGNALLNLMPSNMMYTSQCEAQFFTHGSNYAVEWSFDKNLLPFPIRGITYQNTFDKASILVVTQRKDSLLIWANVIYVLLLTTRTFSLPIVYSFFFLLIHRYMYEIIRLTPISTYTSPFVYLYV